MSLQPVVAGPSGGVNDDLVALAYQNPTPFPSFNLGGQPSTEGQLRAQTYIGKQLRLCPDSAVTCYVRKAYYLHYGNAWPTKYTDLTLLAYPGTSADFSEADFNRVKSTLEPEFSAVSQVKAYFEDLQKPFDKLTEPGRLDLKALGDQIYNSLPQPSKDATSFGLALLGKIASLGGFAAPPVSALAAGVSAAFGLAAFLTDDHGAPNIPNEEVLVQAAKLAGQMQQQMFAASDSMVGLGMIFVSDYGKLMGAFNQLNTPEWEIPPNPAESLSKISLAARQWFAESLVPVAFPWLIRANPPTPPGPSTANQVDCSAVEAGYLEHWNPWINQPASAQMHAVDSWGTWPSTSLYFFSRSPQITEERANAPAQSIADLLFNPINPTTGSLGVNQLDFLSPHFFGAIHVANNRGSSCDLYGRAPAR
jgi:hypothetical protein